MVLMQNTEALAIAKRINGVLLSNIQKRTSLADLAELMGISEQALLDMADKGHLVLHANLTRICQCLNVEPEELLTPA
jgi:DNA-binding Xre family transcriptional regulator